MNDNDDEIWEVSAASIAKWPRFTDVDSLAALLSSAGCLAETSPMFRERNFDTLMACRFVDCAIADTIGTALCEDSPTTEHQAALNGIKSDLQKFMKSLPEGVWKDRMSPVAEDFFNGIDSSLLLRVAIVPNSIGTPRNWKKDAVMHRWLALYKFMTGKDPTYTENGPTERFLKCLSAIAVKNVDASRYPESKAAKNLKTVWCSVQVGFRDWFRKGDKDIVQRKRNLNDEMLRAMAAIEDKFRQIERARLVTSRRLI